MAIADDIAAVLSSEVDDAQKRKQVYQIKAQSVYDALLPFVGGTYRFNQIDWTLWNLWLEDDGQILCVALKAVGTGSKAGQVFIRPQRVFRFVNVPVLDATGGDNRLQAAREMLAGLLP